MRVHNYDELSVDTHAATTWHALVVAERRSASCSVDSDPVQSDQAYRQVVENTVGRSTFTVDVVRV